MVTTITKLLTPREVADLLGVSVATLELWRCTRRYSLPWVKVGRCVRYEPVDVRAFLDSRTHGGPEVKNDAPDRQSEAPSQPRAGKVGPDAPGRAAKSAGAGRERAR